MITIVDSGVANLASVRVAFGRLGVATEVASDAAGVRSASRLVIPGVGAFGAGVASLRSRGIDVALRDAFDRGTPMLAICLGLQVLCDASEESPGVAGLGLLRGVCRRLPDDVRVPHLGWNVVAPDPACRFAMPMDAAFANSFALLEAPDGWHPSWTTHGVPFVASLERGDVLACQFHPELSGEAGARLLRRWLGAEPVTTTATSRARRPALAVRIVPCLDVQDGRVVKGVRFQSLRDTGDPAELAARYEAEGADELVMLDIAATLRSRPTQLETVRRVRQELRIPFTTGGGVRSVEDGRLLLGAGADKVSVNSAAVERPGLLAELSREFGAQCVVIAIDARRNGEGWDVLVDGGRREIPGLDAVEWARRAVQEGAGEILLTSWDRDGTRSGCDLRLLQAVSSAVPVPLIASGGIGSRADVADAFTAGADAVLAASVFHDGDDTVAGVKSDLTRRGFAVRQ